LNVLHINNFHYMRGGSEAVYFNTAHALEKRGHKSVFFSMSHPQNLPCETEEYFVSHIDLNKNGTTIISQIKTAARILYYFEAKRRLDALIDKYPIDIAHLHNIYHELSPAIIDTLKYKNIPMVMTLHDYKMVCPKYSLFSDGVPCQACAGGSYFNAIIKRCAKGSVVKSVLSAVEAYLHNTALKLYYKVDFFISPSNFLMNKLYEMGFKKEIVVIPNFVDLSMTNQLKSDKSSSQTLSIVYFGRLSAGKGLKVLFKAAKKISRKVEVKIIGDGPLRKELEDLVRVQEIYNIRFLGYMRGPELFTEIQKSSAVILPSEFYENNPMSILEAFALGKPVIGSRRGGIPELVKDNETGLTFEPGNVEDLSEKIRILLSDSSSRIRMGENAQKFVEKEFSSEKYYQRLMEIYHRALHGN